MKSPMLPHASEWGIATGICPKPSTIQNSLTATIQGVLPGLDLILLRPMITRRSENYKKRIAAPDWILEIRPRRFMIAGGVCERCHSSPAVEIHHRHYESLWHEEDDDLEALCRSCHANADEERRENAEWLAHEKFEMARFRKFCAKVYNNDGPPPPDAWDRFENWLNQKEEAERWK
jgi:hypothetical protein